MTETNRCLFLIPGDIDGPGIGKSTKMGLEALGYTVEQRNPNVMKETEIEKADLVVCNGMRGRLPEVIRSYNEVFNQDVIVMDLGYFGGRADGNKNPRGYYQIGLNRIGWIPERGTEVPEDRLNDLDVEIPKKRPKPQGYEEKIVLAGQKPDDAQHRLSAAELKRDFTEAAAKIQENTNKPLIFRDHPKTRTPIEIKGIKTENAETAEEVLKRSYAVVTHNSTMGIEALMWGVPVFSLGANGRCFYEDLTETDLTKVDDPYVPSYEERYDFFKRLAYAQWNVDEIERGEPFDFLLRYMNKEVSTYGTDSRAQRNGSGPSQEGEAFDRTREDGEDGPEASAPKDDEITLTQGPEAEKEPHTKEGDPILGEEFRSERFFTQKAWVSTLTGETPKNKEQMEEIIARHRLEEPGYY